MVEIIQRLITINLVALFYRTTCSAVTRPCADVCSYADWGRDARCDGRNLADVPQECKNAKTLQMQDNKLSVLKKGTFQNFTCLKYLHLERNNLSVEVGGFAGCDKVEKVHLSGNHVPTLAQDILSGLPNLRIVFLNDAAVKTVEPRAFQNTTKLLKNHFNHKKT